MLVSKTRSGGSEIQMLYHSFYSVQSRVNWGCYSATSVVRSQRRLLNLAARSLCLTSRKPPDIRTTAVALGGVVESMVSWKMLQDLHVHIHIWPLCNAGYCTMGPKMISEVVSFLYIFHDTILSTTPTRATAIVLISESFLLVRHRLRAATFSTFSPLYHR